MSHALIDSMLDQFNNVEDRTVSLESLSKGDSYDDLEELFMNIADNCRSAEVYKDYSGRGMYGDSCWGISSDDIADVIAIAAMHGLTGAKWDSLGRGFIVYWPRITYQPQEEG